MKENETKFIEHYWNWVCEKCAQEVYATPPWLTCPGCKRKVIDFLPLVPKEVK